MNKIDKAKILRPFVKDCSEYIEEPKQYDELPMNEREKLLSLVYAPSPITGNPMCELGFLLKGSDPGLQQFIKETLMQPINEGTLPTSAEEAETLIKKNMETIEDYKIRLTEFIQNSNSKVE